MTAAVGRSAERWLRSLSFLGFLAAWHVLALILQDEVLPSPVVVVADLWHHLWHGDLLFHLVVTLARVAVAFSLAMIIGTAFGMWMGQSRRVDMSLDSVLVLGLNVPALVTIILCYIWFGLTEAAAVLAVALNKIPTVVVMVREGAKAVDKGLLEVADVYRLPPLRAFMRVYLPQLYPHLMAAARSGLALIWKIVLVVELLGRSNGIGFKLSEFFNLFDITSILSYTLAFSAVMLAVEAWIMRPMERRMTRWRT